jgi:integrase/recombinase XerD
LRKPWLAPGLIKALRTQHLPGIVTVEEAQRLFAATRVISYHVFHFMPPSSSMAAHRQSV